jgi:hypothetical protein
MRMRCCSWLRYWYASGASTIATSCGPVSASAAALLCFVLGAMLDFAVAEVRAWENTTLGGVRRICDGMGMGSCEIWRGGTFFVGALDFRPQGLASLFYGVAQPVAVAVFAAARHFDKGFGWFGCDGGIRGEGGCLNRTLFT